MLRIKSFVRTGENAVCTPIRTAMVAVLLLQFIRPKAMHQWHMSNPVSLRQPNLFSEIVLSPWMNEPIMPQLPKNSPLQGILL